MTTGIAGGLVVELPMRFDVQIRRWSRAAARILQPQQVVVGWVHSCYDRIINIRTPTGRLLTLQGEGRLKAPLALSLPRKIEELIPALPVGALVVQYVPSVVSPPAALKLILSGVMEWDGRVRPVTSLTGSELSRNADGLDAWMMRHASGRGLAPLLPALHGKDNDLSPLDRKVLDALKPLFAGRKLSTASLLEVAARVLGLGEGLTPSGDDLLVGLLVVLHITGRLKAVLRPPVHHRFLREMMARTSDLSAEFIRCALEGDFAEPVALFVRSLFAQELRTWPLHAASLASVGHSSGIDAMVGIVLGCRLLANTQIPGVME